YKGTVFSVISTVCKLKNAERYKKCLERYFYQKLRDNFVARLRPKLNMEENTTVKGQKDYAIGLRYKHPDAHMRGQHSPDNASKTRLVHQAKEAGIESLMLTSACNRTGIYGFAEHPFQLIKLLCDNSQGTIEDFQEVAYVYKNNEALTHIFRVGTGLDSQILGDFEIISQIKAGFTESKSLGLANAFMERLVNCVIQASKKVKN